MGFDECWGADAFFIGKILSSRELKASYQFAASSILIKFNSSTCVSYVCLGDITFFTFQNHFTYLLLQN